MNKLRYREAWRFSSLKESVLAGFLEGYTLNAPSGHSKLGDVTMDLFEPADVKGDLRCMPFKSSTFDTILSDPPWNMDYRHRGPYMAECRRVLKFGGRLVFHGPWVPRQPGMRIEHIYIPEYQLTMFQNLCPVFIVRKIRQSMELGPCTT